MPFPTRNALVHVRLARSFPYQLSELRFLMDKADDPFRLWPIGGLSPCLGSFPASYDIGITITVTLTPSATIATLAHGTPLVVMGRPTCGADGLTYWRVTALGKVGWVAQGTLTVNWIDYPTAQRRGSCDGPLPSTLRPGQRAQVAVIDGTPANFRIRPDGSLPAFCLLLEQTPFTVVYGPVCGVNNRREAVAFWVVQLDDGTKGWIIEVTPTGRVVVPL